MNFVISLMVITSTEIHFVVGDMYIYLHGIVFGTFMPHQIFLSAVPACAQITIELRRHTDALVAHVPRQMRLAQVIPATYVAVEAYRLIEVDAPII